MKPKYNNGVFLRAAENLFDFLNDCGYSIHSEYCCDNIGNVVYDLNYVDRYKRFDKNYNEYLALFSEYFKPKGYFVMGWWDVDDPELGTKHDYESRLIALLLMSEICKDL